MIKKILNKISSSKKKVSTAEYPVIRVKLSGQSGSLGLLENLKGTYFGMDEFLPVKVASVIDLSRWNSFDEYLEQIKKENYKSAFYPFNRSKREGYYSHPFVFANFVPDIVEVNQSMESRQGREMDAAYQRSIDELGGSPVQFRELPDIQDASSYRMMMGVFIKEEGRKQGEIETNEKLIGYISFIRQGEVCLYSQILGHGDYLNKGAMYNLHYYIAQWIYQQDRLTKGIKYMMYASHFDGGDGLRRWKEKLMYEPNYLMI